MRKPANHFQNVPSYHGFKGSAGTVHCQKLFTQSLSSHSALSTTKHTDSTDKNIDFKSSESALSNT